MSGSGQFDNFMHFFPFSKDNVCVLYVVIEVLSPDITWDCGRNGKISFFIRHFKRILKFLIGFQREDM